MQSEKLLKRLNQILKRTTDNGATEAEAKQALEYAEKLMREHDIEMSEVEGYAESLTTDAVQDFMARSVVSPALFEKILACAVAKLFNCGCYVRKNYSKNPRSPKTEMHFVGFQLDTQAAGATYCELIVAARAFARAYFGSGWRSEHNNFCKGFAFGIIDKIDDIVRERESEQEVETSNSTALIVRKNELVQNKLVELGIVKPKKSRAVGAGAGFTEGRFEGSNYSLSANSNRAKVN